MSILYTSHSPESIGKLFSLIIRELEFASPLSLQHNDSSESYQTMDLGKKYQWQYTSSQLHFIHWRFVLLVFVPWNGYRDIIPFFDSASFLGPCLSIMIMISISKGNFTIWVVGHWMVPMKKQYPALSKPDWKEHYVIYVICVQRLYWYDNAHAFKLLLFKDEKPWFSLALTRGVFRLQMSTYFCEKPVENLWFSSKTILKKKNQYFDDFFGWNIQIPQLFSTLL